MVTNGNKGMGDVVRRFAPLSSLIRKAFPRVRARRQPD
jgi:hypothetical protein